MTIRAREAIAAEFLRKALAIRAVAVPELDIMARAAGLLSQRQRVNLIARTSDRSAVQTVEPAPAGWRPGRLRQAILNLGASKFSFCK